MAADTDAAAHDEPLHEAHDRFGILRQPRIKPVFIPPEPLAVTVIPGTSGVIQLLDIAAGAKGLLALCIQDNYLNRIVRQPVLERGVNRHCHVIT